MATNATQSTVTSGTVTLPPLSTSSITITGYPASGTSKTTTFTSAGVAAATINGDPRPGNTIAVGSMTYTWHSYCGTDANCVVYTGNTTTDAQNISKAIDGSCGDAPCAANTAASATYSGSVVYIVNLSTSVPVTLTNGSGTYITLSMTSIPATSTNACSGTTERHASSTISTLLRNIKTAINDCPPATNHGNRNTDYHSYGDEHVLREHDGLPFSASVFGLHRFTWAPYRPARIEPILAVKLNNRHVCHQQQAPPRWPLTCWRRTKSVCSRK